MRRTPQAAAGLWLLAACSASFSTTPVAPAASTASSTSAPASASSAPPFEARPAPLDRFSPLPSSVPSVSPQRTAVPVVHNPVAALALAPTLQKMQEKLLPRARMTPDAVAGMLLQGQRAQLAVSLQPERCYAVIATSPSLNVFAVELVPERDVATWAAQSSDGTATLGAEGCLQVKSPTPAVLRVIALTGAGPVAAQLYER